MHEPIFGVVLLNWNGYNDTAATLASLLSADPRPRYVVVVDNGSHDDSATCLSAWGAAHDVSSETRELSALHDLAPATWLRVVLSEENRGFAGGNNVGLAHLLQDTDATHVLLLNNDALVAPDYFARMAEAIAAAPDVGVMGCVIYHFPETDRVWFAGGYEDRWRGVALHQYALQDGNVPYSTGWVTGCAMLISRDLLAKVGGLAECYFPIYSEDIDFSLKARGAGSRVMIAPAATVFHKVGGTVGVSETVPRVAYWQNRHRVFYIRRNYSTGERTIALAYLCIVKPVRAMLHVLRGRVDMASAICRGLIHGLCDEIT
jgi:GT2 family glycosyltransferase